MPRNLNNITQTNGYTITKPNIKQEWSSIYMAKTNQGTGNCGKIIPVYTRELIPGQTIDLQQDVAIQFTPFLTNLFHEIKGELITYFVPYRICAFMRDTEEIDGEIKEEADQLKWESYITGGKNGRDNNTLPYKYWGQMLERAKNAGHSLTHTLMDYFGMPIHQMTGTGGTSNDSTVNCLPFNAYNLIYNTKLRNPDFTPWKQMIMSGTNAEREFNAYSVATAYWNADRFTRARAMQQRGIAPNIPINSTLIELAHELTSQAVRDEINARKNIAEISSSGLSNNEPGITITTNDNKATFTQYGADTAGGGASGFYGNKSELTIAKHQIEAGTITAQLNLNEFLYDLGILQYEANMARIKPRYTDFLNSQFGIIPEDSRFQEPEWLSSNSFAIGIDTNQATATGSATISSETVTTRQGEITSQAWGGGQKMKTKYKALEHGLVMTLMIIRPMGVYEGGLERFWEGKRTRFSFPLPETVNLPDQEITHGELHFTGVVSEDTKLFGWETIHDQYRTETNQVCGLLRPSEQNGLASYTLARYFADGIEGTIDDAFLKCNPNMERIKQYTNQPDFIFFVRTENRTAMPIPLINQPINLGIN